MCIRADELLTGVHAFEGSCPHWGHSAAPDPLHSFTPQSYTLAGCRGRQVGLFPSHAAEHGRTKCDPSATVPLPTAITCMGKAFSQHWHA